MIALQQFNHFVTLDPLGQLGLSVVLLAGDRLAPKLIELFGKGIVFEEKLALVFLQLLDELLLLVVVSLVLLHQLFVALHQGRPLEHVGEHAGVIVDVPSVDGVRADGGLGEQLIVDCGVQLNRPVQLALQVGDYRSLAGNGTYRWPGGS